MVRGLRGSHRPLRKGGYCVILSSAGLYRVRYARTEAWAEYIVKHWVKFGAAIGSEHL